MKTPVYLRRALEQVGVAATHPILPVAGGDTAHSGMVESHGQRFFIKQHRNRHLLEAEARGLLLLGGRLRVPKVLACEGDDEGGALILEYLPIAPLRGSREWMAAGQALARLHKTPGADGYGLHPDNFIGATPQSNRTHDDWVVFFASERLEPLLQRARQRGLSPEAEGKVERVIDQLEHWLLARPHSGCVHGDLWQGNLGQVEGEPVFYDPACYYGDPQVDLAMLNLFGGVPSAFYEGYQTEWPVSLHYRAWPVYDLYHWLNHYTLFGGQYGRAVEETARRLLTTC
ncbi:MAG: fructosamine kinase family protein [Pseudomonadota bacterium]|nr:fructosamine kinase family protein [Pseudomonadota bacterium]